MEVGDYNPADLEAELQHCQVVVAEHTGRVLGYASCGPFESIPIPEILDSCNGILEWGKDQDKKDGILSYLRQRQDETGGDLVLRQYDNASLRDTSVLLPSDYFFHTSLVKKTCRDRGYGKLLAAERVKLARESSASAIFANCWMGGTSWKVLRSKRFQPVIHAGPMYNDGVAVKSMIRRLTQSET